MDRKELEETFHRLSHPFPALLIDRILETEPGKQAEAKLRRWMCACDEMQIYKYCHCLLFVREDGLPITEYLPEGHEGREIYGLITDPTPDKGRALKHKAAATTAPPDEPAPSTK